MSILKANETSGLRTAVTFMTAGESDGVPDRERKAALSGADKLAQASVRAVWISLSQEEIEVLWIALGNGAEGVLQPSSGLRPDQKKAFRRAANRIREAGGLGGPSF
jgi:hypothetical protein